MMGLPHYDGLAQIGKGGYGTVYKAKHKESGEIVAVKKVRIAEDGTLPRTTVNEISHLKRLYHPNIVRLIDVTICESHNFYCILLEYSEQDMHVFLFNCNGYIQQGLVRNLMRQLLNGVAYCHSKGILHRDLKPPNLLLNRWGILKITDFGSSKDIDSADSIGGTSYGYLAPDVIYGNREYTGSIDMWSAGCIFAQISNVGQQLFPGRTYEEDLHLIFQLLGTPPITWSFIQKAQAALQETSPGYVLYVPVYEGIHNWPDKMVPGLPAEGKDLLQAMLRYDPHTRISAYEALRHDYFENCIIYDNVQEI